MPEKFWRVPFPCLACNVKLQKQRAATAEHCQGRFLSLSLLHKHMQLFLCRGFLFGFVLFSSLSSTKLLYCCIPLVMIELTAVMAAASTMTLESRRRGILHRLQMDFQLPQLRNNKNLNVYLEGFLWCRALLMVIHAICTFGRHAMLNAFKQMNNQWPSSHPLSQSTWIAGKSYCASISFYHCIALLMCLVMSYG